MAVKVRHPGVVERMWVDFAVLDTAARMLELGTGATWMGLRESLAQFGHALEAQVRFYAGHRGFRVRVPRKP